MVLLKLYIVFFILNVLRQIIFYEKNCKFNLSVEQMVLIWKFPIDLCTTNLPLSNFSKDNRPMFES